MKTGSYYATACTSNVIYILTTDENVCLWLGQYWAEYFANFLGSDFICRVLFPFPHFSRVAHKYLREATLGLKLPNFIMKQFFLRRTRAKDPTI